MKKIISLVKDKTDDQIQYSGVVTRQFISFERLLSQSINQAAHIKHNERVIGVEIVDDGISCFIETKK